MIYVVKILRLTSNTYEAQSYSMMINNSLQASNQAWTHIFNSLQTKIHPHQVRLVTNLYPVFQVIKFSYKA